MVSRLSSSSFLLQASSSGPATAAASSADGNRADQPIGGNRLFHDYYPQAPLAFGPAQNAPQLGYFDPASVYSLFEVTQARSPTGGVQIEPPTCRIPTTQLLTTVLPLETLTVGMLNGKIQNSLTTMAPFWSGFFM